MWLGLEPAGSKSSTLPLGYPLFMMNLYSSPLACHYKHASSVTKQWPTIYCKALLKCTWGTGSSETLLIKRTTANGLNFNWIIYCTVTVYTHSNSTYTHSSISGPRSRAKIRHHSEFSAHCPTEYLCHLKKTTKDTQIFFFSDCTKILIYCSILFV